jgi:hypothetical protein
LPFRPKISGCPISDGSAWFRIPCGRSSWEGAVRPESLLLWIAAAGSTPEADGWGLKELSNETAEFENLELPWGDGILTCRAGLAVKRD